MMMNNEEEEQTAYLDITLFKDGECVIELSDNGKLANLVAEGIINDDKLFAFFANVLMNYQLKLSSGNNNTNDYNK